MKVSIITVTYNSQLTLQDTINSVAKQDYDNIEYIIVDGDSIDATKKIIIENSNVITKWISEPDNGLYDAMNKGIKMATGDIIGIINSDDFYLKENVISEVVNIFIEKNIDAVHGELFYVDQNNTDKIVRHWKTGDHTLGAFQKGWHPAHPTLFIKREIYKKYGVFDLNFKLAADFELMCRFFEKYSISSYYLNMPLIKMRLGGATSKNLTNIINQNKECYRAFKINDIPVSNFYVLKRILPKLKQYFK
jgi:glycosyltransferase involved in cell wall biosynthesis